MARPFRRSLDIGRLLGVGMGDRPVERASTGAGGGSGAPLRIAGVMSGTSGDGVAVAIVELSGREFSSKLEASSPGRLNLTVLHHVTVPYEPRFKARLFDLFDPRTARLDEICRLNVLLADEFARAIRRCAEEAGISLADLDLIGSHGQTICHLPPSAESGPGGVPSTLQIGDVSVLAERTGVMCVGNFRTRDMAAGGEGAPLVPVCDWLLFGSQTKTRVVQNIGGIANMTVLPRGCGPGDILACDTGPGNMLIDEAVRIVSGGMEEFDRGGERAARGRVDRQLVARWLAEPFFHLAPPKSTGRELFGRDQAQRYIAEAQLQGVTGDDLIATLSELTVQSMILHYRRHVPDLEEVIVGGGGARNDYLMRRLAEELKLPVQAHEAYGIPSEAKEAIAFALLAYLTVNLIPGNVPGATGAYRPVVLGVIAPGADATTGRSSPLL